MITHKITSAITFLASFCIVALALMSCSTMGHLGRTSYSPNPRYRYHNDRHVTGPRRPARLDCHAYPRRQRLMTVARPNRPVALLAVGWSGSRLY